MLPSSSMSGPIKAPTIRRANISETQESNLNKKEIKKNSNEVKPMANIAVLKREV